MLTSKHRAMSRLDLGPDTEQGVLRPGGIYLTWLQVAVISVASLLVDAMLYFRPWVTDVEPITAAERLANRMYEEQKEDD